MNPHLRAFLATRRGATRISYRTAIEQFNASLGARHLLQATSEDVGLFRDALATRARPATVTHRIAAVSAFFRWCVRQGLLYRNPAEGVRRPRVSMYRRARKLTRQEFHALLSACDPDLARGAVRRLQALRDRAILLWMVYTGRRRAEVVGMLWRDLELSGGRGRYSYSGKGGKEGNREIPPPALAALLEWAEAADLSRMPDHPVFGLSYAGLREMVKRRARQAKVREEKVCVHGFRHLAVALRREAGATLEQLRDFCDHCDISTTSIYLEAIEGTQDEQWEAVQNLLGGGGQPFG